MNSIIIKPFGRPLVYGYLDFKLREVWKPAKEMQLIDLGHDFFLAQFQLDEDYTRTIIRGP